MKTYDKILKYATPLFTLAVIIFFWAVASKIIDNEFILPSIGEVVKCFFVLLTDGEFYKSLGLTLTRSFIAFLFSYFLAFILSLIAVRSKTGKRVVSYLTAFMRAMPTIAVVLLLLFWTSSFIAPIIVTVLVVMPTLFTAFFEALSSIRSDAENLCKVFHIKKRDRIFGVVMPSIMPTMINSVGNGLSLNLKLMVAAEVLAGTANSLGFMLSSSKAYFEIAKMISLVVAVVIIGILTELVFGKIAAGLNKKYGN